MVDQARATMLRSTEWWLFRQALPKFIVKQGFRSHTLARMFPFLLFVVVNSAEGPLEDFLGADWRVTLAVSPLPSIAVWLFVTRAGRRPPPPVPIWLAVPLVIAYFLIAPLAIVAFALARPENFKTVYETSNASSDLVSTVILVLVVSAILFGVANFAIRYGLVALVMNALKNLADDLRNSFGLLGHALPAVLFLTAFLFFTPEIWQLTEDLNSWHLGYLFLLFAVVVWLAIRARLSEELDNLETAMSAPELERACHGTPLEPVAAELAPATQLTGPRRDERRNILRVLTTRQLIRAAVVGLGVFLFFELFGWITVSDRIAAKWLTDAQQTLPLGISVPMLKVSALLAGFSVMYFAVSSMTDGESRKRYFDPVLKEISRVLAVRAVYLKLRETPPDPAPGEADPSGPYGTGAADA